MIGQAVTTPIARARISPAILCLLAALVLLAYLPTIHRPLLEDDYPNILQAEKYGPASGWITMAHDPVFRVRATSWVGINLLAHLFGTHAEGYYACLILLHMINAALIYSLGAWPLLGYELSAWAAAFFAVYEGHQEAVMWLSACPELLMAGFGLASFLLWVRFLQHRRATLYVGSIVAFSLALVSKESAVIFVPLLILPLEADRKFWRRAALLAPYAVLAALVTLSIAETRSYSFRFNDGSFSLHAPFWRIWPENVARLFWFWGLLAVIAILAWKPRGYGSIFRIGFAWIGLTLLPYSFLTYSTRIPSRQFYLASVGLALLVGFALSNFWRRWAPTRPAIAAAVCILVLGENVGYLWTKKRSQFIERAAPTEQLIALARRTSGPIYVRCFPRPPIVAESAVEFAAGHPASDLIWTASEAAARQVTATFCYTHR